MRGSDCECSTPVFAARERRSISSTLLAWASGGTPWTKPTSICRRSAWRPNPGRDSTFRRRMFVQTIGASSPNLERRDDASTFPDLYANCLSRISTCPGARRDRSPSSNNGRSPRTYRMQCTPIPVRVAVRNCDTMTSIPACRK